ncbi:MAG: hypothetical protein K6T17_05595, partial [Fimbriimonadales bacterium]|nr:hypothetical protein [Fimbriimonadales bacterium]
QPGAIAMMAGVEVGTVANVELEAPNRARMTLHLHKDVFVPKDAELVIPRSFLALGEQRVEIRSQKGRTAGTLPPGSVIPGRLGSALESGLPEGVETLTELNRTLASVRSFFEDDTLRNRLDSILVSVQKSVTRAESLLLTAQRTVQENRPALKDAIARASEAMAQLKEGVSALRALAEDPLLAEDIRTAVRGIRDATTKANELLTDLDALINDPQLRASIETTLLNVEQISRTGTEIAENTRQITSDGKIVSAKAIELADRANELAEEAKRVLEKLREFAEQLPREFRVARPSFRLESARNTERGAFQTDVIVEYPLTQKASLFAGVFDATEGNLLNLQYGLQRGSSTLRYGIYASKPGLGVDWQVVPGVLLSADLFDPNDPRLDARARFNFGKDWYLYMGANRIGDRNEPLIGLGVKR